ncbi:MAG: hypothetical protein Q8L88_07970 [Bacteroidota bacterium]|nr:hypothetical protein [Bacteroidota bacterium]
MTTHSEAHIIFYSFICFIIGVGLFFSRSMDKDVNQYFWAGLSKGGGMIVFSIFLLTLFNAMIIALPSLSLQSSNIVSVITVSIAIVIPFFFAKKIMTFIGNFLEISTRTTTVLLNILGLIFLCSVQLIVLVQITDFVIVQFFGSTQYSILVVMIVAAGIYTIAGGLNAVLYSNIVVGSFSLIGIVLIFFNTIFLKAPLFFSFSNTLQFGTEIFRASGITEPNLLTAAIGIMLIMFWMIWMGIGEAYGKVSIATRNTFQRKLFGVGSILFVIISGILFLSTVTIEAVPDPLMNTNTFMNYFIAVSFIGGLMGIFAMTFQMSGSIVAVRLYPYFKTKVEEEEQILVARLSTVFVVLLAIIYISVAKVSGYRTFIWYINFVAFFFTPIITSLLSTIVVKKGAAVGFMFGIVTGETYAVITLIGQQFEIHTSLFQSSSAYAFAVEIAAVTLFAGIVSAKASEMVVVQKMLSRMRISRSTTL